jgi:hypothetical protein
MASATKRGQGNWLGRYRDPSGRERTRAFPTKGEALPGVKGGKLAKPGRTYG